jgi:DNA-binding CsgD family transcriptional regulator
MRVEFYDDVADAIDIAAPPRCRVAVTTHRPNLPPELGLLTDGQRDCLRLVYNHMTSKDIARVLGVSPHTVDMRLRTAMKTLAVGSRIEAARLLVQHEAGGEVMPDSYQPLIYHTPDVAPGPDSAILGSPASNGVSDSAHHDQGPRFSPVVDPIAGGPPRMALASVSFDTELPTSWAGAAATDPGTGARPLAGSVPWGKKNDLSIGARLGWIVLIAIGSALAFGSILGAIAALKTLQ